MHKNFAYYADIMLMLLATYYAPNYAGIIGAGLLQDNFYVDKLSTGRLVVQLTSLQSDMFLVEISTG